MTAVRVRDSGRDQRTVSSRDLLTGDGGLREDSAAREVSRGEGRGEGARHRRRRSEAVSRAVFDGAWHPLWCSRSLLPGASRLPALTILERGAITASGAWEPKHRQGWQPRGRRPLIGASREASLGPQVAYADAGTDGVRRGTMPENGGAPSVVGSGDRKHHGKAAVVNEDRPAMASWTAIGYNRQPVGGTCDPRHSQSV